MEDDLDRAKAIEAQLADEKHGRPPPSEEEEEGVDAARAHAHGHAAIDDGGGGEDLTPSVYAQQRRVLATLSKVPRARRLSIVKHVEHLLRRIKQEDEIALIRDPAYLPPDNLAAIKAVSLSSSFFSSFFFLPENALRVLSFSLSVIFSCSSLFVLFVSLLLPPLSLSVPLSFSPSPSPSLSPRRRISSSLVVSACIA